MTVFIHGMCPLVLRYNMKQLSYNYNDDNVIDVEWVDITPNTPSMIEVASQLAFYKYIENLSNKPNVGKLINEVV